MKKIIFLMVVAVLLVACTPKTGTEPPEESTPPEGAIQATVDKVLITTNDNVEIAASFYKAPELAPAFILIPMLGSDQSSYDLFLPKIIERGYHAVTLDHRGHGLSEGDWKTFSEEEFKAMPKDIKAVVGFLNQQPEFNGDVVLVGASIGANTALSYATIANQVRFTVLLSPGLDYRGIAIEELASTYEGSVEIIVGREDTYSFESSQTLQELLKGKNVALRTFAHDLHGTNMLTDALMSDILSDSEFALTLP